MDGRTWPALDIEFARVGDSEADADGYFAAFLDDYSPTAIVETSTGTTLSWRVFFASPEARARAGDAIPATWPTLRVATVDVADEHWAERSQASLRAIRVGRVVVTPPWDVEAAAAAVDEHGDESSAQAIEPLVVVIEPSMGFGTGHHESTRLCLRALQQLDLDGRTVIDLGTGSGVLAIAAARLGCARAVALDDDVDAVEAARLNITRNQAGDRVEVRCADLASDPALRGDVVLGNLTGALLRRLADAVRGCLVPGGSLVLSGFTEDERIAVEHAFAPLVASRQESEAGWVALTLSAPQPAQDRQGGERR